MHERSSSSCLCGLQLASSSGVTQVSRDIHERVSLLLARLASS